jgi:NAD(P)-dependent dehydrogenase (short-subunit alcohol dehydrogenase family)
MGLFGFGKKKVETKVTQPAEQPAAQSAASVVAASTAKPLSGDSTVREWLDHPVGGAILRDLLRQGGQDEKTLRIVQRLSLYRLASMSHGQMTKEQVDELARRASAGEMPAGAPIPATAAAAAPESSAPVLPEWEEAITSNRFSGRTVIVTGSGSGIGRATASRVAREGGRVIAVDISRERLDEFKASLPGADITTVIGDITDDASVARIVAAAGDTIDALANVAGIMDNMTPLHEMSDAVWNRVMGVNVLGAMKLSRAVLPKMLAKNKGAIVNVGSEASLRGSAAGAAYTTSKHAIVGLSKSMAFMYGPSGVRTNVVAPGAVLTNIEAKYESTLGSERVNMVLATIPDAANPEALAASITFLLSDDGVNLNGVVLPSDGGWSIQ